MHEFYEHLSTLLLCVRSSRELKVDTLARQTLVHLAVRVQTVVDASTLLVVKEHLENLLAVRLCSDTLADNLDGVDEITEDSVVDSRECSRTRSLLSLVRSASVGSFRARQDAARSNDQNMTVGKLFLELANDAGRVSW